MRRSKAKDSPSSRGSLVQQKGYRAMRISNYCSLCGEGHGSAQSLRRRWPRCRASTIAVREDISLAFLEQIFVKLRRAGLVRSIRGPGGGYVLGRSAEEIRIHEIIESVEQTLVPVACMDENGECNCDDQCIAHTVWEGLGRRIRHFLSSITLADLTRDAIEQLSPAVLGPFSICHVEDEQ
ncbi:MAG: Rrf2 family transcriptional regulator [Syntrophotaleaceae bacterium]